MPYCTVSVTSLFERIVGAVDDKIALCEQQSGTLATLRDTLLPRLLSGELRVPVAERLVEVAM